MSKLSSSQKAYQDVVNCNEGGSGTASKPLWLNKIETNDIRHA